MSVQIYVAYMFVFDRLSPTSLAIRLYIFVDLFVEALPSTWF